MGKFRKAIAGLLTGGGLAGALSAFGLPVEIITPAVALGSALMVYWVPNASD